MPVLRLRQILPILLFAALAGCASTPTRINNVCAVFAQKDGWIGNWRSAAERTERKYGVPVAILMATVRTESGFKANARPPRTTLFGIIPWKRQSSAYGYSQALDGTWTEYQVKTGNFSARRTSFGDAIDFVGWYHAQSSDRLGIERTDAYRLYLAYYSGWSAYQRGQIGGGVQQTAQKTAQMAASYDSQLAGCN